MSLVETLRAARALVDTPEKWGQGAHFLQGGARCMSGALISVGAPLDGAVYRALCRATAVTLDHGLSRWNDAPERTHADVLAAFDKAIEAAKALA